MPNALFPAAGGARHAVAAVVVDVRGAERDPGELAEQIGLLVGQRARTEHADRVGPVLALDALEGLGDHIEGSVPACRRQFAAAPRTSGVRSRSRWSRSSPAVQPFMHSAPALTGNSGSPAIAHAATGPADTTVPHWNATVRTVGPDAGRGFESAEAKSTRRWSPRYATGTPTRTKPSTTSTGYVAMPHTPAWSHDAGLRVEPVGVERAHHLFAGQHPVGQRPALVRAFVRDREHLAGPCAEHGDCAAADPERPAEADRQVVQFAEGGVTQRGASTELMAPVSRAGSE